MLHSCGRHYGGQIAGAQQCHPYASYASWDGSCRGCPGDDEKEEEEAKEGSKFLGATMVANWEEAAIWALRQVDGRTPTRGPAIILQFHKNAPRNVRRVTKQGGPENPAARQKFPESLGTRPEACCDVETSFQWWQILNPAIWLPGGQDYHRQVSSRCVPGHSWWAEGRGCHLPDNTRAMERDCQWILEEMERPPCLCSSRWEALCHKMSTEQRISLLQLQRVFSPLCSLRWLTPIINFCGRMLGDTNPCQMPKFTMNPTWRRPWRTTQLDFHLGPPSTRRPKCAIFPTWRRCLRPQNLLDETLRLTGTDQRGDDSQLQVLKRQKGSWECIWHPCSALANSPRYHVAGPRNSPGHCGSMHMPTQHDAAPLSRSTKCYPWPRRWRPQHHPWRMERRCGAPGASKSAWSQQRCRHCQKTKGISKDVLQQRGWQCFVAG